VNSGEIPVEGELPEMCVAVLEPETVLIGIKRGQRGYFQMYDGMVKGESAKIVADRMNKALEVTPQQREAMLCGSMMGWDCPAAKPSSDLHAKAKSYCEENAP
jgi:formylmethanofuran dehydrogenase subunit C